MEFSTGWLYLWSSAAIAKFENIWKHAPFTDHSFSISIFGYTMGIAWGHTLEHCNDHVLITSYSCCVSTLGEILYVVEAFYKSQIVFTILSYYNTHFKKIYTAKFLLLPNCNVLNNIVFLTIGMWLATQITCIVLITYA